MIIGTLRPEEAKASDGEAGYHQFTSDICTEGFGSFEVFWRDADEDGTAPGWYWWSCSPGCLPDGDASGPFGSSIDARADADDLWLEA